MAAHVRWLARTAGQMKALAQPLRLGVRGIVLDRKGAGHDHVLLVRHTYVAGWYLPGGGVEAGESALSALARELAEETGIEILGVPFLHGFFFNPVASRRDHVACYVIDNFHCRPSHGPDLEIAEMRFFPVAALPAEATRATRARIDEVVRGVPAPELW